MDFEHGTAIAKMDIGEIIREGEFGLITAYLPTDNTFAIFYQDNRWFTFKESEEWFLNHFTIKYDAE